MAYSGWSAVKKILGDMVAFVLGSQLLALAPMAVIIMVFILTHRLIWVNSLVAPYLQYGLVLVLGLIFARGYSKRSKTDHLTKGQRFLAALWPLALMALSYAIVLWLIGRGFYAYPTQMLDVIRAHFANGAEPALVELIHIADPLLASTLIGPLIAWKLEIYWWTDNANYLCFCGGFWLYWLLDLCRKRDVQC